MIAEVVPILRVTSLAAAQQFYCSVLGFTKDWQYDASSHGPSYMSVSRDGHHIHLSTFGGDSTPGAAVYFYVSDVDELHRELRAAGLPEDVEPVDQTWGQRELYVRDPDGNSLRFGMSMRATDAVADSNVRPLS